MRTQGLSGEASPDEPREDEPLRILVVEDEPQIANFLRVGLGYEGFSVAVAEDGYEALAELKRFKPQLVILDLMLPGIDGMELAKRIREGEDSGPMIIMLTARDQVEDRIAGLRAGADDYLIKPFDFEELVARIHAVTRRRISPEAGILTAGPITLDQERHLVTLDGSAVELTVKEYDLLLLFLRHTGRVLSRRFILDQVWGHEFYDENNVEVYVRYLRRKLDDAEHQRIETVRGVGYRLRG
jgi:two-component system, OmpR family, response regulator MprA